MTYIDRLEMLLSSMLISAEQQRLKNSVDWNDKVKRTYILGWLRKCIRSRRFGQQLAAVMNSYEALLINDKTGLRVTRLFDRIYGCITEFRQLSSTYTTTSRRDISSVLGTLTEAGYHVMQGEWLDPVNSGGLLFMPHGDWVESFEPCCTHSETGEQVLVDTFYKRGIVLIQGTREADIRLNADVNLKPYMMRNININNTSSVNFMMPTEMSLMTQYVSFDN
ncbi:hypothetical protein D3C75_792780 [compost metagenome]